MVDAGSALTIDFCNDNGDFLGGAILPGAQMMLDAMHAHTARLPAVKPQLPAGPVGVNTEQAMLHGVYYGIRGAVKELVERLRHRADRDGRKSSPLAEIAKVAV